MNQKTASPKTQWVGLILPKTLGIMCAGDPVYVTEGQEGVITSGGYSPTLDCSIALARIPITAAQQADVVIDGAKVTARITTPAFVKRGTALEGVQDELCPK